MNFGTYTYNVYFKGLLRRVFFGEFYHSAHACWYQNKTIKMNEGFVQSICRSSIENIVYSLIPYFLFIELLNCVMFWWQSIIKNNLIKVTVILICYIFKCKQSHLFLGHQLIIFRCTDSNTNYKDAWTKCSSDSTTGTHCQFYANFYLRSKIIWNLICYFAAYIVLKCIRKQS